MKCAIFIVIFVSVVYAKYFDESIYKEIFESLNDVSDTSAEDKIFKEIDDYSTSFLGEEGPQFDYVSDTSDGEGREINAYAAISKDYINRQAKDDFDDDYGSFNEIERIEYFDEDHNGQPKAQTKFFHDSYAAFYEIGYSYTGNRNVVFKTFHSLVTHENHYVHYIMKPLDGASGAENPMSTSQWRENDFPVTNIDCLYTVKKQLDTIGKILGNVKYAEQWIKKDTEYILTRGHLAANGDFPNEQLKRQSTYTFFNAAPQFQIFNNGNWKLVEESIRDLTKSRGDLEIYSGTHGVGKLKVNQADEIGRDIYLGWPKKTIPMPKLFYKMAIKGNEGIVVIGVNNPYLTEKEIHNDYIICTDIADQLKWLRDINRKDRTKGYIYACSVEDFIQKVQIPIARIPEFPLDDQIKNKPSMSYAMK
ncbi:CLUMA_CG002555, isoform A [Clunio marinus]|uniref:CLUMA_CG002555, isoform A n=1 Tax=Clunio marinus TaxID=568069 RepID=A0A1J1HLB2_9DIPT|nr:CLUMA_CG002555, isoform A [Clunio marinus]